MAVINGTGSSIFATAFRALGLQADSRTCIFGITLDYGLFYWWYLFMAACFVSNMLPCTEIFHSIYLKSSNFALKFLRVLQEHITAYSVIINTQDTQTFVGLFYSRIRTSASVCINCQLC